MIESVEVSGIGTFTKGEFDLDIWGLLRQRFLESVDTDPNYAPYAGLGLEDDRPFLAAFADSINPYKSHQTAMGTMLWRAQQVGGGGGGGGGSGYSGPSMAQQAAQMEAEIRNLANLFGVEGDWGALSWEAAQNHWNAAMIKDNLAERLNIEMINKQGIVNSVASQVRTMAGKYYVQLSDSEIFDWAKRFASDEIDNDTILAQIKNRAKVKFSALSEAIDNGTTVEEYFRPHRELIAQLMDTTPAQIDLMNDTNWLPVLENLPGQENRPMNLYETGQFVRSNDKWKQTTSARDFAAAATINVGKIMGSL